MAIAIASRSGSEWGDRDENDHYISMEVDRTQTTMRIGPLGSGCRRERPYLYTERGEAYIVHH